MIGIRRALSRDLRNIPRDDGTRHVRAAPSPFCVLGTLSWVVVPPPPDRSRPSLVSLSPRSQWQSGKRYHEHNILVLTMSVGSMRRSSNPLGRSGEYSTCRSPMVLHHQNRYHRRHANGASGGHEPRQYCTSVRCFLLPLYLSR